MAFKVETGKTYHAQNPGLGNCVVHVIGGSVNLKGSNVTEIDPETHKLIVPAFSSLVETGDTLSEGIYSLTGLPEWVGFDGDATEIWVKMGVDARIEPGE